MQYGESLEDLGRALAGHPIDAILLMCSQPEGISAGLPILRQGFSGPIGGYATTLIVAGATSLSLLLAVLLGTIAGFVGGRDAASARD